MQHTVNTSAGPTIVEATQPAPGLRLFELPADVSPMSPNRWILAHHDGHALASFESSEAANAAARHVGPLADWTRNAMTVANLLGPAGMADVMQQLTDAGGQHPNA